MGSNFIFKVKFTFWYLRSYTALTQSLLYKLLCLEEPLGVLHIITSEDHRENTEFMNSDFLNLKHSNSQPCASDTHETEGFSFWTHITAADFSN